MPKISVIVPVFNVEKYLGECLESVLAQSLADIEIICLNDGSTDNSLKILEEYSAKDERIKIVNKENSGYGHTMNLGLATAKGDYVGIVESDDFVKNTMFEDLLELAEKFDADVVKSEYYDYTMVNGKPRARKNGMLQKFKKFQPFNIKNAPELLRKPPSIWSAIYKREFLNKNNIRFLETAGASFQDTSFSLKALCLAEKIVLTPKAYLYYRQDNAGSSVKSKNKVFAICDEYAEADRFLDLFPETKSGVNTQKLIKQYSSYIWNLLRIDESLRGEFVEKFAETFKAYAAANEITDEFYKKVDKKEFSLLVSDTKAFCSYICEVEKRKKLNDKRKKLFSVRINFSRVSIVLFGKQIVEIG